MKNLLLIAIIIVVLFYLLKGCISNNTTKETFNTIDNKNCRHACEQLALAPDTTSLNHWLGVVANMLGSTPGWANAGVSDFGLAQKANECKTLCDAKFPDICTNNELCEYKIFHGCKPAGNWTPEEQASCGCGYNYTTWRCNTTAL